MNAEKANIQTGVDAAEIPEYVFESLARSLLPVIQKYYESEGGKKAFAEWKAKFGLYCFGGGDGSRTHVRKEFSVGVSGCRRSTTFPPRHADRQANASVAS